MSIENLRQVIRGRPVAILLPGPSIKQLKERIAEIKDFDLCYASVNDFWVMENNILDKIGKQCEIVLCAAKECGVPDDKHFEFLRRKQIGSFITQSQSIHRGEGREIHDQFVHQFKERLVFFTSDLYYESLGCPNREKPFHFFAQASFILLICFALIGGADTVFLFGADGGDRKGEGLYYKDWGNSDNPVFRLGYDTGVANMTAMQVIYQTAITHGVEKYRIINCSTDTYYAPFAITNHDGCFEMLKAEYAPQPVKA